MNVEKISKDIKLKKINQNDYFLKRLFKYANNSINEKIHGIKIYRAYKKLIKNEHFDLFNYHDSRILFLAKASDKANNSWMMNDPPSIIDSYEKETLKYRNTFFIKILIKLISFSFIKKLKSISKITVLDKRNQKLVKFYFNRNAKIIRTGINLNIKSKRKNNNKIINILTTNILFPYRRYEDVIDALNVVINKRNKKNIHYWIVGEISTDYDYYKHLNNIISNYNLGNYISFLGSVSEEKLNYYYNLSDIFIFPNFNQTWGLSVFEAMLHECAVIVSDKAGSHEVLSHSKNSLIFESKNVKNLANLIILLIENKSKRIKMAIKGKIFVKNNLSWEKYSKDLISYIK